MPAKSGHHLFVINNYTDDHINNIRNSINSPNITYICYQKEIGSTGTPHLQGYCQFTVGYRMRFSTLNRLLGGGVAQKECRGSSEANRNYCSKAETAVPDSFTEFGECREIGSKKRKNNDEWGKDIIAFIKKGCSVQQLIAEYPQEYIKHSSGMDKVYKAFSVKPLDMKYGPWRWSIPEGLITPSGEWGTVLVVSGPTNIGKTEWAKSLFPNPLFIRHVDQLKGFNPLYHGGIVFDDMTFVHWPRESNIFILDVDNPAAINARYANAYIPAHTKKVFTTNLQFEEVFVDDPATRRRVTWMDI